MEQIFENSYIRLYFKEDKVFIEVFSIGFDLIKFNLILKDFPNIALTNFMGLKKALEDADGVIIEIGTIKPNMEVSVSKNKMEVKLKINMPQNQIEQDSNLKDKVISLLNEQNINYGINEDIFNDHIIQSKEYVIAKGKPAIHGKDAIIVYKDKPDLKPTIKEDGQTDYYDMHLIEQIEKNDWLGEKIPLTDGEDGYNVYGEVLPAKPGKNKILSYDRKSVIKTRENDKIILRARINGALSFSGGKIGVINHLHINGDVGIETGNIDFDGHVTVSGTVHDGFSIKATKDISINSTIGLGAVNQLTSTEGSIFIKGGISGKQKTKIYAHQDVFTKYVNSCTVEAGESINIGFYALDSELTSKRIIVNSKDGKIIGGTINAESQVVVTTIGNQMEKRTVINVKGFNRNEMKKQLDEILIKYKYYLNEMEKNAKELKTYESLLDQDDNFNDLEEYEHIMKINENLMKELSKLDLKRQSVMKCLESKGEGEISIMQKAFPQTFIEIKNLQKRIESITIGTFYADGNKLHFE